MTEQQCHEIHFTPSGLKGSAFGQMTLSEVAVQAGVALHLTCGGLGKCGKCRVKVVGRVSPPTSQEREILGESALDSGIRLACQTRPLGPLTVAVLQESMPAGMSILRWESVCSPEDEPSLRWMDLELAKPTLSRPLSDEECVRQSHPSLANVRFSPHTLRRLGQQIRADGYRARVIVEDGQVLDVRPGNRPGRVLGAAVDLGTTTVAGMVVDLGEKRSIGTAATTNKQAVHGEDAVSRIAFCGLDDDKLAAMQGSAVASIDEVIGTVIRQEGIDPQDLLKVVVVGNTAMGHLLMGVGSHFLTQAPYVPVFKEGLSVKACDIGMKSVPAGAVVTLLPFIAGFVGADTVGVILAAGLDRVTEPVLAIDIGTNGEVVLAMPGGEMLTCSAAAGPAFEGAHIEMGMRASAGAITHVSMRQGVELEVLDHSAPQGICGTGIMDAVAWLLKTKVLDETGRFADEETDLPAWARARLVKGEKGPRFLLSEGSPGVWVSQRDIREMQLAKGALRAGIEILLKEAGVKAQDLSKVLLAGAFGSYVHPWSALRIGLIPAVALSQVKAIGNAAGVGATQALVSERELCRARDAAIRARYVEISGRMDFQEMFADAMSFPVEAWMDQAH